jgi:tripartite-type tricarboxylate transporter receptor subunit TctC
MPILRHPSTSKLNDTILTLALLALIFCLAASSANAQTNCPDLAGKTIRWIVPYSAGGGYDTYSRLVAPYLGRQLGAQIRVDNVPGSGGLTAAKLIKQSPPDGLTVGLVNTPGMLAAMVTGLSEAPNPAKDYTIIGRMNDNPEVFVVKADSTIRSIDDLFALAEKKPVLYGVTGAGSSIFLNSIVTSSLLGIEARYVVGYRGTRQTSMAVMRGEVDLTSTPFSTVLDRINSGDLRATLQITSQPLFDHPALKGVPVLGGPGGLAALRARQLGLDGKEAAADADALVALNQSGRLVVAPVGLEPKLAECLQSALMAAMTGPDFIKAAAKAKRPLRPLDAKAALKVVEMAAGKAAKFAPIVKNAVEQVRK